MTKFEELQATHQQLLAEIETDSESEEVLKSIQDYIERVKGESEKVADPRERDQLRANLRFWAAFVFDRTGTYPNTTLRPPAELSPTEPPEAAPKINYWILGGIGAILLLILIAVASYSLLLAPRQGTQQATQVAAINTQNTQNTQVAVAITQTGLAIQVTKTSTETLLPTRTQIPTSSPTAVVLVPTPVQAMTTPDHRTATVAALLTQAVQIVPTSTPVPLLPQTGGGGECCGRLELAAVVFSEMQTQVCTYRAVQVRIEPDDLVSAGELAEAVVKISQAGNLDILNSATLSMENNRITFDLSNLNVVNNTSFLLQFNHPDYNASNIIFRFSPDCSNEILSLDYHLQERDSRLLEQPPHNPNLSLDWRLLTWGPAPDSLSGGESDRWVASIILLAEGGEDEHIFWAVDNNIYFQPILDNKILIEGQACEESRTIVGLTSRGQSTLRELLILSPYCPEEALQATMTTTAMQTPTTIASLTPAPTRTSTPTP